MQEIISELSYEGRAPMGPCSAWPYERNLELMELAKKIQPVTPRIEVERIEVEGGQAKTVKVGGMTMVKNFIRTSGQALANGKVSQEIRDERYATCEQCPFFLSDSKRCSECGCFMEAKTWIGGDPATLCPKQKWSR